MFVERLSAIMKEQGVTRSKLLTDLKMGKNQFKVWERGGKPTVATISVIANYLGTTVEYLTGETDEKKKPPVETEGEEDEDVIAFTKSLEGLSEDEIRQVMAYAEFLKKKRKS